MKLLFADANAKPTQLHARPSRLTFRRSRSFSVSDPIYLSAAIAIAISVVFGLSNHIQHIALDHMDVRTGTIVNVGTSMLLLWLLSPLFLVPQSLGSHSAMLFGIAGLIVPAVSISFATLSVKTIGPGLTAGLSATSPVFAMVVALVFLGETVTGPILVGTLIVIFGIMVIALRSQRTGANWPLWALGLPLIAALSRGISHPIVKTGLADLPSPMTAALVSSTVSFMVLATMYVVSRRSLPAWNNGYLWFGLCGVFNGIGITGLGYALQLGEVVVVSPLVATTPAFTLLMGHYIFRRETISRSSVAAISIIFIGSLLIIIK
jgi:DME family drug/metabolite transporter